MPDIDVRELREELAEFKLETVQRLARIEERLTLLVPRPEEGTKAAPGAPPAADSGAVQALGKVSVGLVEWGKFAFQIVAAVVAALLAVKGGIVP